MKGDESGYALESLVQLLVSLLACLLLSTETPQRRVVSAGAGGNQRYRRVTRLSVDGGLIPYLAIGRRRSGTHFVVVSRVEDLEHRWGDDLDDGRERALGLNRGPLSDASQLQKGSYGGGKEGRTHAMPRKMVRYPRANRKGANLGALGH